MFKVLSNYKIMYEGADEETAKIVFERAKIDGFFHDLQNPKKIVLLIKDNKMLYSFIY